MSKNSIDYSNNAENILIITHHTKNAFAKVLFNAADEAMK